MIGFILIYIAVFQPAFMTVMLCIHIHLYLCNTIIYSVFAQIFLGITKITRDGDAVKTINSYFNLYTDILRRRKIMYIDTRIKHLHLH